MYVCMYVCMHVYQVQMQAQFRQRHRLARRQVLDRETHQPAVVRRLQVQRQAQPLGD